MSRLFSACAFAATACDAPFAVDAGGAAFLSEHAARNAAAMTKTEHAILRAAMANVHFGGHDRHRTSAPGASIVAAGIAAEVAVVGRDALVARVSGATDRARRRHPAAGFAARQRLGRD